MKLKTKKQKLILAGVAGVALCALAWSSNLLASPTISSLQTASGRAYEVVNQGLKDGATSYIDRSYTFSSVPSHLVGATYIKTANDDKTGTGDSFVYFKVDQPVSVYIAHDDRITSKPNWLSSFSDTQDNLNTDALLSLYKKDFPAGDILLGGNTLYGESGISMYSIIVKSSSSGDGFIPSKPIKLSVFSGINNIFCGDGICNTGEDSENCAFDCGTSGPVCGNGTCESGEDNNNCPEDCRSSGPVCGDGTCESGEDCINCSADCGSCSGDTYYISSSSGSDSNPGTQDKPWKTLYKASSVGSGSTILLKRGDRWTWDTEKNTGREQIEGLLFINGQNNLNIGAYGSGNKPLIDRSAEMCSHQDPARAKTTCLSIKSDSYNISVNDIEFKAAKCAVAVEVKASDNQSGTILNNCDFSGAGWNEIDGCSNEETLMIAYSKVFVNKCFFDQIKGNKGGYSKSIEFRSHHYSTVKNSLFKGYGSGGALRWAGQDTQADYAGYGTAENNFFYHPDDRNNAAFAIVVRSQYGGVVNIRNNVFDLRGSDHSNDNLRAIAGWHEHGDTVRNISNNTVISSGNGYAIKNEISSGTIKFYNNLVYNTAYGIKNTDSAISPALKNNLFYSVGNVCDKSVCDNSGLDTSIIISDNASEVNLANPNFSYPSYDVTYSKIWPLAKNFAPQLPSKAIDAGVNDSIVLNKDFLGVSRPQGNRIDIGAFEY